ncbi:hypothetical protein OKW30_002995 [Paraburkholderia sp. Clong3]|nr:hypothetical protein [Paraburkholderia sp. CI2]
MFSRSHLKPQRTTESVAKPSKRLLALLRNDRFTLAKLTFGDLQSHVAARNEALEWGRFPR